MLVGACAESLAGWGSFPNWKTGDGRAVLWGGAQCEVAGRGLRGSICFLLWGEPGCPKSGPGPGFLTGASRLTAIRYPLSAYRLPLSSVRQQPKIWRGQVRLRRDQGELFDDGEAGTAHQLKTGLARPYRSSGLPLSATRLPLSSIRQQPKIWRGQVRLGRLPGAGSGAAPRRRRGRYGAVTGRWSGRRDGWRRIRRGWSSIPRRF